MRRREPGLRFVNLHRMFALAWLGRTTEACRVADETVAENADDMFARGVTALKHALLGEAGPVEAFATGEGRSYLWNDPEWPWWVAGVLALVDKRERAMDWLERAVDRGWINYPAMAHLDPLLEDAATVSLL
jgi:non-specific serine/threonine protein kinase